MNKTDQIRQDMTHALRQHEKDRKDALSILLSALKKQAIDKRDALTLEEENTVILKEIKQMQETIETAPDDRKDVVDKANQRIAIYQEYAPKQMSEEEIEKAINQVLEELSLDTPTLKDKGLIMKNLMPRLKGKADGTLINQMLSKIIS